MLTISFLDDQAYGRNGPKADFDVEVRQDLTTLWTGRVEGHWKYKGWVGLLEQFVRERKVDTEGTTPEEAPWGPMWSIR